MNYTKTNPVGIDYYIQETLQTPLYNRLVTKFGLTDQTYNQYGRCYRKTDSDRNYMPIWFKNQKEQPLLTYDDKTLLTIFFDIRETITVERNYWNNALVDMHVLADIAKWETLVTGLPPQNRFDNELRIELQDYIEKFGHKFHLHSIQVGAKKAWSEFSGDYKKNVVLHDLQPLCIMRFDLELKQFNYNKTQFN